MNKKWEYYTPDKEKVSQIVSEFKVSELVAKVLVNRNITEPADIKLFLNPTRTDFHNPFLLQDMDIAVERIKRAIIKNEKVIIYGDYDVDGITSISVLKKFLDERGIQTAYHIPNRLDEGYGLNKEAIKQIADDGYKLMITVDCGISRNG